MVGSCGRIYEAALPHRKKSCLEGFLIFACIHCPHHCWCPSRVKDAFAALGVASSSSHQFLAVKPFNRFAYGMHGLSLSSGFCSCGRYSHWKKESKTISFNQEHRYTHAFPWTEHPVEIKEIFLRSTAAWLKIN